MTAATLVFFCVDYKQNMSTHSQSGDKPPLQLILWGALQSAAPVTKSPTGTKGPVKQTATWEEPQRGYCERKLPPALVPSEDSHQFTNNVMKNIQLSRDHILSFKWDLRSRIHVFLQLLSTFCRELPDLPPVCPHYLSSVGERRLFLSIPEGVMTAPLPVVPPTPPALSHALTCKKKKKNNTSHGKSK